MGLRIRRIDNARDFMALAPVWAQLVQESGQTSPFFSHDWFWCCWHGVWPQRRPEILVIEERGSIVALVPLMHWRGRWCGLPVRYLGFLEYPNTPLVDILTVGEHDRVVEAFLDHLASRSDWDTACLRKLPATSPSLRGLEALLPGRFPWRRTGHQLSPYTVIAGGWESFFGAADPSFRETSQRICAQIERAGDVSIEEHRAIDLQSPLLQETLGIMRYSMRMNGATAVVIMPRMQEFFRELTRRASKNGWLSLWALRFNGHPISIEYQLRSHGKVQALWAGDDPEYQEFLPGNALNVAILQSLFACGSVSEYSTGPGVKADQFWWSTACHEAVHLQLCRPSLYSRMLDYVQMAITPWSRR